MNRLKLPLFDIKNVLFGGQTFTWDELDNSVYLGVTQDRAIKFEIIEDEILWQTYPSQNDEAFIDEYFRTDIDSNDIKKILSHYGLAKKIDKQYLNVRMIKQPIELTLLSFILSSNKNIKAIRRSVSILRERYGDKVDVEGREFSLFPKVARIAQISLEELKDTGIGYRAKYLIETANMISNNPKLLVNKDKSELKRNLLSLSGIGPKVADCILCFGYGYNELSPVDVWTKRILVDLFDLDENLTYQEYADWIAKNFDGKGAWIMQVLFEWYRNDPRSKYQRKSSCN